MKVGLTIMVCVVACAMTYGYTMYSVTFRCAKDHQFKHAYKTYECRTK